MNKESLSVFGVVAFGAALLVAVRPAPAIKEVQQAANAPARTIQTNGSAVVKVKPDKVTLRLGVMTYASTPRESQGGNARIVDAVLKAVRGTGVPASDITTDFFAVRPEYDYNGTPHKVVGYWTNNAVVITLKQVDKLSGVLGAALEAGATSVDDVTFSTSRLRELRDQARALAVKAAMEKARGMAEAAGATLGEAMTIVDNTQWHYDGWFWSSRMSYAANMANMSQNVVQVAQGGPGDAGGQGDAGEDGEFSLGQIVVQAQVDLTAGMK